MGSTGLETLRILTTPRWIAHKRNRVEHLKKTTMKKSDVLGESALYAQRAETAQLDEEPPTGGVRSPHPELDPNVLRRVRDFIAVNLDSDIRVRDLAAFFGMSESHFAHRFRATAGISPHRFVMTSRLDTARLRLQCSSDSVLRIAFDCGFKDASHFSRVFKKFIGCTPKVFRREGRSASSKRHSA